jgi:hypothetical protein
MEQIDPYFQEILYEEMGGDEGRPRDVWTEELIKLAEDEKV